MKNKISTLSLIIKPNILQGIGRLVDFGNNLNHFGYTITTNQSDYYSIKSDWLAVGNDIKNAYNAYESNI